MDFLLNGLFRLTSANIEFIPFAIIFLLLVAELGLARFQRQHLSTKKILNAEEFIILLMTTFKFLKILRIKRSILLLIFAKIDKNNDQLITFDEYLDWIKKYLAVDINRG